MRRPIAREAVEIACKDELNMHKGDPDMYKHMKQYLHTFVFDHRGDDVPEGENRWEYLTEKWKSDLGEYCNCYTTDNR